ncbi:MAG: hypothetical protein ACLR5F_13320 [Faecalibacterium sp.]
MSASPASRGADPTLVYFKGKYYLFVDVAGFWYDAALGFNADPDLLIYDYVPDAQVGAYLYFASRKGRDCPIYRTADPLTEPFTEVSAPFRLFGTRICSGTMMAASLLPGLPK